MVKGKWIDKNNAVTFKLVHRPQNDPLIHDETAPSMVLAPTASSSAKTGKSVTTLNDLASQLGPDAESLRDNEGEAAEHGIFYDDADYDYMQHLRDPGTLGSGVVSVEAKPDKKTQKGKGKGQSLEQALMEMDLKDKSEELLDADMLPSKNLERPSYQSQQEIQDSIAGFQPDMNPELREVLEALDDDAYVDEDDDTFQELAKDAMELSTHEFEGGDDEFWDDEDEGWESDVTEKPAQPQTRPSTETEQESCKDEAEDKVPELIRAPQQHGEEESTPESADPNWMTEFQKFKQDQKQQSSTPKPGGQQRSRPQPNYDGMSSIITGNSLMNGRKKKRKGALTNPSNYSMTSSALVRTEHQRLLDDRFETRMAKMDAEMDDRATTMSNMSTVTTAPREDFDAVVDEFLQGYKARGKSKKGGLPPGGRSAIMSRGVAELDAIRKELGPPLLKAGKQVRS